MQCTQCGKQWPDTYKVCPECVAPLVSPEARDMVAAKQKPEKNALWGARIHKRWGAKDYPSWANRRQQEKWREKGLMLWDEAAPQVTRLTAVQAVSVLEHLRTHEEWKETGITLGEPATELSLNNPKQKPKAVLMDKIHLTVAQTQELFVLLQNEEMALREMKEQEEQDGQRRLNKVYRILLGDEVWRALGQLYQEEPEKALKLAQELVGKAMGK